MEEETKHPEMPFIKCDECLKEIPQSVAQTYEGEEYFMYFCGLECYKKWKSTSDENKSED